MTDTTPAEMREQAKRTREGLDATRVWSESDLRAGADALDRLADAIDLVMNRNVVTERPNEQERRLKEETDD